MKSLHTERRFLLPLCVLLYKYSPFFGSQQKEDDVLFFHAVLLESNNHADLRRDRNVSYKFSFSIAQK